MIRLLHTADWHIGQTLNGWSRQREHEAFLASLANLVTEREIDALIVAGDIFDSQNPSAEATRLLYSTLVDLRRRRPHLTTILTAGNHDPAGRIEAPRPLFRPLGVHAVGFIHRRNGALDLDRHLIPIAAANGDVEAFVLAVPYPSAADLPGLRTFSEEPGSPVVRALRQLYAEMIAAARARMGHGPLAVTGHLHVAGATESEGAERRILVGGEHAVPHDIFPDDLAYVALGHLHKPQHIGRATVRYAGSPFPLSATERPYDHGVTVLTIGEAGVGVEHVPMPRPAPHLRLPAAGAMPLEDVEPALAALALAEDLPIDARPFVQFGIRADGHAPGLRAEVERLAEAFPVRPVGIVLDRPAAAAAPTPAPPVRLADCDPIDLFARAFVSAHGFAPDAAHLAAFHTISTDS